MPQIEVWLNKIVCNGFCFSRDYWRLVRTRALDELHAAGADNLTCFLLRYRELISYMVGKVSWLRKELFLHFSTPVSSDMRASLKNVFMEGRNRAS
jgi:hypothetical protein